MTYICSHFQISWASIGAEAAGAGNISAFRSLRTLRAFRPLRAVSRWQGMKVYSCTSSHQQILFVSSDLVQCCVT